MNRPIWQIAAQKYNQNPHYTMPVQLVEDDGERLWFHAPPGSVLAHHTRGQTFTFARQSDMYFWRGRWYNVYVNRDPDGTLQHFYCNVGLPPVITDSTLTFVDLDLDVQISPGGACQILDADEFRAHSVAYAYPPDVRRAAWQAILDIIALWRARKPPFDQT
jgi:hypothetical protein